MRGDYDRAISDFTQTIRLDPKYVNSYDMRDIAYAFKGNYTQARADVNKVLQLDPKNKDAKDLDAFLKQKEY
jgi:tetratricopeptide (TPR) repeat protein